MPKTEVKPAELKLAKQLIEQQQRRHVRPDGVRRRGPGTHRSGDPEEGRRTGDLGGRSTRRKHGQGHRPDGGAARESGEDGSGAASTSKLGPRKAAKRVEEPKTAAAKRVEAGSGPQVVQAVITLRGQRCNPTACGTSNESCACRAAPFRGLIKGGFVKPTRGPRRQYRFSFQDLIVLRTARALDRRPRCRADASVARSKTCASILPETVPLSGLSICAVGDRVVVRDGKAHWQVDDRPVRARARRERRRRRAAGRGAAQSNRSAGRDRRAKTGSVKAWSSRAPIRARRSKPTSARSRRSAQRRRLDQLGTSAARTGRQERGGAVYRRALEHVRTGSAADVQPRRRARGPGPAECSARSLPIRARAKIRTSPTVTTTSRGCTSRSASRSTRFGTSASTADWY